MVTVKKDFSLQSSRTDDFWSKFHSLHNLIQEESENIGLSDKFSLILGELEQLHQLATTPRQQVIDAKVLSDFVCKLSLSIKTFRNKTSPTDFITCMLHKYGEKNNSNQSRSLKWKEIGKDICDIFGHVSLCSITMVVEPNKKRMVSKKRMKSIMEVDYPEDLDGSALVEKTETIKNIHTMFEVLKTRKKSVKFENVILNKNSFGQTTKNLFALSFLVSMGRAEIKGDDDGHLVVSLRNAPNSNLIKCREVQCKHFIHVLGYEDWNMMKDLVGVGDEVMPHRNSDNIEGDLSAEKLCIEVTVAGKIAYISEELCIGCGICVKVLLLVAAAVIGSGGSNVVNG
ncbi:non-structural maintenance of chromosomes element 4 homolog A-like [Papaver somniferum]|uniref:non-structural maintenance of chromosomes element 4 homolog A-like n=1 Tax=Papaver somniferum TaxID=3469 RepID=UPI000E702418|nr:non-structural maintenance of chromosomes element 4 homolog A-like [Papaver somniferum]